jgi:small conductance mechanosensitive channel
LIFVTVFIPNEKILRDFVINYQVTPTRRIKLDIPIRYIRDILRTKQLLENIMVEDPRVLENPPDRLSIRSTWLTAAS